MSTSFRLVLTQLTLRGNEVNGYGTSIRDFLGGLSAERLPSRDSYMTVSRVDLHAVTAAAGSLGGDEGRPGSEEGVDHDIVRLAAVFDRPLAKRDRLRRWMLG